MQEEEEEEELPRESVWLLVHDFSLGNLIIQNSFNN